MIATGLIKTAGTVSDGKFTRKDSHRQYPNAQRSELLFIITVQKYEPFDIFPLISNLKVKIAFSLLVLLRYYDRILCSQHNFLLLASNPPQISRDCY